MMQNIREKFYHPPSVGPSGAIIPINGNDAGS
jgi:hypothetical protein